MKDLVKQDLFKKKFLMKDLVKQDLFKRKFLMKDLVKQDLFKRQFLKCKFLFLFFPRKPNTQNQMDYDSAGEFSDDESKQNRSNIVPNPKKRKETNETNGTKFLFLVFLKK